jgi:hypothetical protein
VPRGPATRPVEPGDAEALQSALTRARAQAAAPVPPQHAPEPERPGKTSRVEETEPVAGATVRGGPRGARSFRLEPRRRKKAKEKSADGGSRDPRGKGGRVDLRV